MAPLALALALLAAVMHATWNFFLKGSADRLATAALMVTLGTLLYLPWVYPAQGVPDGVWDHIIASSLIQGGYFVALATAYDRVDFSVAYPLARGIAPALVAIGGWLLLDDAIGPTAAAAVGLVVAALVWLAWSPGAMAGVEWAVLTGVLIALYTINDAAAVRHTGQALSYTVTISGGSGLVLVPLVLRRGGREALVATWRARPAALLGAAALNIGAYALVLFAATKAPVGLVAAVRETSVVIGALAGVVILKEPFGRRRLIGAAAVAAGIAVLGLA